MPRASHFVALNVSFGQRSFLMGAGISESKEVTLYVEQGDFLAFDVDLSSLAGRDLTRARRFYKFAHALSPLVGKRALSSSGVQTYLGVDAEAAVPCRRSKRCELRVAH